MDESEIMQTAGEQEGGGARERQSAEEARRRADMREFAELFPEAAQDPRSIPREVWEQVRRGYSLVGAYARFLLDRRQGDEQRRREMAHWNADTAARSTGSMRSAESGIGGRDSFLQGFLD